jgi:hypothetical protein
MPAVVSLSPYAGNVRISVNDTITTSGRMVASANGVLGVSNVTAFALHEAEAGRLDSFIGSHRDEVSIKPATTKAACAAGLANQTLLTGVCSVTSQTSPSARQSKRALPPS